VKYVDTSAVLRVLFSEPGPAVPLTDGDAAVSSELLEVEAFRAVDRERLLGNLNDAQTAAKRKELADLIAMLDLAPIDRAVIGRAKSPFAVNVRALDATMCRPRKYWRRKPKTRRSSSGRTTTARAQPRSLAG
jgi:predicted nucleic acid-binding protein